MAKLPYFIFAPLRNCPKPYAVSPFRYYSVENEEILEHQLQTQIAAQVSEIIQTQPRWETTLISRFPSVNLLDPKLFDAVLKLQGNVFFSLRLFNWFTSTAGFSPNSVSCKSMFDALVEAKASVLAKRFIETVPQFEPDPDTLELLICCLCEDGHVGEVLDLFEKLKSLGVCPSISTWNAAISGSVKVKRTDIVWALYGDMIDGQIFADLETLGHLIQAFCIDNKVNEGYELLRQVREGGVAPSNVALNRLISELSLQGDYDKVSELLHFMIKVNNNPDIYTYQGIIYGLCKKGKGVEGYRIFKDLKTRGYAPDRVMYTTMIHGLCQMRQVGEARKLWFEMIRKGMSPNEYTYNVLIGGFCRIHLVEEAWKLHKEMCDKGIKLTTFSYNIMLAGLCKNGKIGKACNLFEEMNRNCIVPDVMSYNTMIAGLCRRGDWVKGEMLFRELVATGLQLTTGSYAPLIRKFCRIGRTQQAFDLWKDMESKGVEASSYIQECIIVGLCKGGFPSEGMQCLFEMLKRKLVPQRLPFDALIVCLLKKNQLDDALLVLNSMLDIGYKFHEYICSSLVRKLCSNSLDNKGICIQDVISMNQVSEVYS